jgi:endonuclease YncB( thermonuclease family)
MGTRSIVLVLAFAAVALAGEVACVPQETVAGRVDVTDGDSFAIGATRIRLFGIDAPEGRQPCTRHGVAWRCGNEAAAKLRGLVGNANVTCRERDRDDYGRIVAVCSAGGVDLGAEMVRSGFALAYRQYSDDYVGEERAARAARRGVWAGEITPPWEWRRTPQADEGVARAQPPTPGRSDCGIKGNINRDGDRIYHVPGSASYEETSIDENRGERWFCSETEARAAGWRAPARRR